MFGYNKIKYSCVITNIRDNDAVITLCDDKGEYYFEIPLEHLKNRKIECKVGAIFKATFSYFSWFKWGKMVFYPSKRLSYNQKKIEKLNKYYANKYGDI